MIRLLNESKLPSYAGPAAASQTVTTGAMGPDRGVVKPRDETAALTGGTISYRFPPASVTRLQITVA